ncbi:MAG: hydrogenase maturation factor [Acetatifactor sp.]|nr:hydrogenase maturation factor [Acetatifactor sp.]
MKTGKVSGNVLRRSVLRQLHSHNGKIEKSAGIGEDCAFFTPLDASFMDAVVSCMQEGPVCAANVNATDIGEPVWTMRHLILRSINNLAASGAEPVGITVALMLPETAEEEQLKALMQEADAVCKEQNITITGGQTRVTKAVSVPFAVITGYGRVPLAHRQVETKAKPNQDIVVSKWIGLEGTAYLANRHRDSILKRYPAYLVEEAEGFEKYLSILPEAATAHKSGVCAMHDASEGGIFAALWEMAEKAGVGLTIDLKKLPLRQETVEVCEHLGVNPYELRSGGCLVMVTENGEALQQILAQQGIPSTVIGRTTDSNDRLILNEDEVRYMDRPKQDSIYTV